MVKFMKVELLNLDLISSPMAYLPMLCCGFEFDGYSFAQERNTESKGESGVQSPNCIQFQ
jgi:hypothetical protein